MSASKDRVNYSSNVPPKVTEDISIDPAATSTTVVKKKIIRNNSKPQLPWKQKDIADNKLYLPMFKLAKQLNIHLVKHGGKEKEWTNFVDNLFNLDTFKNYEKLSITSVRTQYDNRIATFKKTFGYEDSVIGNNLNLGNRDLSELDEIIKELLEEQPLDNTIRLHKSSTIEEVEEKNEINDVSETIFFNQNTNTTTSSLRKRKKGIDVVTTSNESNRIASDIDRNIDNNKVINSDILNTASMFKDLTNAFQSIATLATMNNNKQNENNTSTSIEETKVISSNSIERDCEEKLLFKIDLIKETITERLKLQENDILLYIIENLEALINTYCAEGMKFNQFQIKQEFKNMLPNVNQMIIANIFLIFEKVRKDTI